MLPQAASYEGERESQGSKDVRYAELHDLNACSDPNANPKRRKLDFMAYLAMLLWLKTMQYIKATVGPDILHFAHDSTSHSPFCSPACTLARISSCPLA